MDRLRMVMEILASFAILLAAAFVGHKIAGFIEGVLT